ncbi:MAG: low molecular weight phosphatase family protein [Actinomycetota bacterium]
MFKILIVCTGNICRSPIAHGLLVDRGMGLGEDWLEVRSAGTWGRRGSRATPEAISAAAGLGVDIESHRSAPFKRDLAGWADLIVTMTAEQAEEVAEEAPDVRTKTFTLKELVSILRSLPPVGAQKAARDALIARVAQATSARSEGHELPADSDVSDPLGLSETVYRAVANEIEGLVEALLKGLAGNVHGAIASEG